MSENFTNEIFSLFQTKNDLDLTQKYIFQKYFKTSNKELFALFSETYGDLFDSPISSALAYSLHIFSSITNNNCTLSSQIFDNYSQDDYLQYTLYNAFHIISAYYTSEYLLRKHRFYHYSSFKDLHTLQTNYYTKSKTKYGIFFSASEDAPISKDQSNHTRYIRYANESIFQELINYRTDIKNEKKVPIYYLSDFLPKLSFYLAEKSSRYNSCTLKVALTDNIKIDKKFQQIFNDFYEIGASLYDPNNILKNVLNFYKLEYAYGILSTFSFLQTACNSPYINQNNLHTFNILTYYQKTPDVYSAFHQGLYTIDYKTSHNKFMILFAKITFALLADLYDNKINNLHTDLGNFISDMYEKISFETHIPLEASHYTCWHIMHLLFGCFANDSDAIKTNQWNSIKNWYHNLSSEQESLLRNYLLTRYSQSWFKELKELFAIDIETLLENWEIWES